MGLVPLFLPFVWAVELNSCASVPTETEFTGLELVAKFDAEFWALFLPALALCIAMPLIAARLIVPVHRMLFQIIGLLATLLTTHLAVMLMFFTIFAERRAQGAGWVVLALFFGALADALFRVWFSVVEWRASRKAPA